METFSACYFCILTLYYYELLLYCYCYDMIFILVVNGWKRHARHEENYYRHNGEQLVGVFNNNSSNNNAMDGPWSRGVRGAVGMRLSSVVYRRRYLIVTCYVMYIRMNVTSLLVGRCMRRRGVWLYGERASERVWSVCGWEAVSSQGYGGA